MTTRHTVTPTQFDTIAELARQIRETADRLRAIALTAGEFGTVNECEATRAAFTTIAARATVAAAKARLAGGELRVQSVDAMYAALDSFRPVAK